ncbi:MAG: hypothetical protein E7562_00680 [Ruminococcaceae bacterium]|nr:hypothetical protein [Oscillospiraceae bacterium]
MKRMFCIILICIIVLCGCGTNNSNESALKEVRVEDYHIGLWVSYSELNAMLKGDFKLMFEELLKNCVDNGITDLFIHVRAFCDAVYPSSLFPITESASVFNGDLLEYMIESVHNKGIAFHAWINPYRVRTADENIDSLPIKSPVKQWLSDEDLQNDINVCFSNGIYLNPASSQVRRLIIDGIRELLENYKVDGIHFDDYFYPTADASFDEASYNTYKNGCVQPLSLYDWRRSQVNQLISGVYTAVKFYDKNIIFSVSPAASLEKNKNELFADIEAWVQASTVDWIIPQLYFGFEYPDTNFCFDTLLEQWFSIKRNDDVRLMIGLAAYKIDTESAADRAEWNGNIKILAQQAALCKKNGADGHIFFSSSALFSKKETNRKALEELRKIK